MTLKLPIGIDDFHKVIEGGYVYVDKTLFVEEVLGQSAEVLLITRPRRFGKTLNMSMLAHFFDQRRSSGALFPAVGPTGGRPFPGFPLNVQPTARARWSRYGATWPCAQLGSLFRRMVRPALTWVLVFMANLQWDETSRRCHVYHRPGILSGKAPTSLFYGSVHLFTGCDKPA